MENYGSCSQVFLKSILIILAFTLRFVAAFDDVKESSDTWLSLERLRQIADYVNSAHVSWTAALPTEWEEEATSMNLKYPTGSLDPRLMPVEYKVGYNSIKGREDGENCENNGLPKSFDAGKRWPTCTSIKHIYDQGNCGSCWAVATTSVFTDRLCIQSKGKYTKLRSIQQVLSCCHKGVSKDGCNGGWSDPAFDYMRRVGVVTGGDYDSSEGCQPYRLKPCAHHVNGTKLPLCSSTPDETAHKCKLHCYNKKYGKGFKIDRVKAKEVYKVDPCAAMNEIYRHGPIVAAFAVYEDFYLYKSGVYSYTTGKLKGWHVVRVVGWGEEKGIPYWLVTNSWNKSWGHNGYFKIIRGPTSNNWFEEHFVSISLDL